MALCITPPASQSASVCLTDYGNVNRIALIAIGEAPFPVAADITTEADWTTAKAATPPDQMFISPVAIGNQTAQLVRAANNTVTTNLVTFDTSRNPSMLKLSFKGRDFDYTDGLSQYLSYMYRIALQSSSAFQAFLLTDRGYVIYRTLTDAGTAPLGLTVLTINDNGTENTPETREDHIYTFQFNPDEIETTLKVADVSAFYLTL
jgi:hypothetical protein